MDAVVDGRFRLVECGVDGCASRVQDGGGGRRLKSSSWTKIEVGGFAAPFTNVIIQVVTFRHVPVGRMTAVAVRSSRS